MKRLLVLGLVLQYFFYLFVGGAQIIDMMLLVVDIVKGMQTQTAECLVIGEILCEKMVVVLNKVDLIDEKKRTSVVDKVGCNFTLLMSCKVQYFNSIYIYLGVNI